MSSSSRLNSEHSVRSHGAVGVARNRRDLRRFKLSISRSIESSRRETVVPPTRRRNYQSTSLWLLAYSAISPVRYVGEMYWGTSEAQVRERGAIRERCGIKLGVIMILIVHIAA